MGNQIGNTACLLAWYKSSNYDHMFALNFAALQDQQIAWHRSAFLENGLRRRKPPTPHGFSSLSWPTNQPTQPSTHHRSLFNPWYDGLGLSNFRWLMKQPSRRWATVILHTWTQHTHTRLHAHKCYTISVIHAGKSIFRCPGPVSGKPAPDAEECGTMTTMSSRVVKSHESICIIQIQSC